MSTGSWYFPRYLDREPEHPDLEPVQAFEGAGGDLNACPRCLHPVDEDREYCELCRSLQDEPLDLEGE